MNINILQIDGGARKVCSVLQAAGFQAFIVGGCVRDLLLETVPKDWDICTDASPEEVMNIFPKTYPTGLQHGTVTVSMGNGKDLHYEVTTFRTDGKYTDGRRPDSVQFVKNIEEDLLRRDFTINAIAYDPVNDKLIDPFHGIKDLQNKVLRAVGFAVQRFTEDGLRIMRAARFAARLNYTIEHTTLTGMAVCSYMLENISKERIKDELCKILQTAHPSLGLQILRDVEALEYVLPYSHRNEQEFSIDLKAIEDCKGNYETKMAILIGEHEELHFVESTLRAMTFSNDEIKRILFVLSALRHFEKLYLDWHLAQQIPPSVIRMGLAFIKNHNAYDYSEGLDQFIKFIQAIKMGGLLYDLMRNRNQIVWGKNELRISGKDLIEMGIPPGPKFKELLDLAYLEIVEFPEHNQG